MADLTSIERASKKSIRLATRRLEQATDDLKRVQKIFKRAEEYQLGKVRDAKKGLQDVCLHGNVRDEDAFDYHKREAWTEHHCIDCGKYLGKD